MSSDSKKQFSDCFLCLKPAQHPCVSPNGYLYCYECILNNIVTQKSGSKKKKKEISAQISEIEKRVSLLKSDQGKMNAELFAKQERGLKAASEQSTVQKENEETLQKLTDQLSNLQKQKAKDSRIVDPICGSLLKLKQLVKIRSPTSIEDEETSKTPENPDNSQKSSFKFSEFSCPICNKTFSNSRIGCVLGKCGHALCELCLKTFWDPLKPQNKIIDCFVCHKKSTDKDLIKIKSEGTAFASTGNAEVKVSDKPFH